MKSRMLRGAYWVIVSAVGLTGIAMTATAAPPDHPTVCHATGSKVKPYVKINPGVNGAYRGHFLHHDRDVIPPFEFQGTTYSLNWPSNIVDEDCRLLEEPPEVLPEPPVEREPPFTG